MFSEISTPDQEDFEFDLEGIDLPDFKLVVDSEEGIFLLNDTYRFLLSSEFFNSTSSILHEESNDCPPLILRPEQKEELLKLFEQFKFNTN